MIAIENKLVSDALIEEQFVCDLVKCKGGCCVDGDAGAPLEEAELQKIGEVFEAIRPYLPQRHLEEIEKQGKYLHTKEFGWVTPVIDGGICVFANVDVLGIVKCGFEQAYNDGKTNWKKPISCHLFPVRVKPALEGEWLYVNYEPRQTLCKPACKLGQKLKVPVYQFLKEPLIRKFGAAFYEGLEAVAEQHFNKS